MVNKSCKVIVSKNITLIATKNATGSVILVPTVMPENRDHRRPLKMSMT